MAMTAETEKEDAGPRKKVLLYDRGRTYFSREGERKLFFVLTVVMLVLGVLVKLGLF